MATAWTDEESTRLTELHAAGKSLTFIAKEMQRSICLGRARVHDRYNKW